MGFIEKFHVDTGLLAEVSKLTPEQFSELSYTDRLAIKNNFPSYYRSLSAKEREIDDKKISNCGKQAAFNNKPHAIYTGELAYNHYQSQWQLRGRHGKFL